MRCFLASGVRTVECNKLSEMNNILLCVASEVVAKIMTQALLSPITDLFERIGLVIGTGRQLAIDFSVGTLVAQDRKVSFEFERDLIESKPEGPATLTKINLEPVGDDGVDLPVDRAADIRMDVPALELDPQAAVSADDTTTDNAYAAPYEATAEEEAVPDEEEELARAQVASKPHDALTVSTTNPELTMQDEFAMTEEILVRSLSPSMREAYQRHLHDIKKNISEEQKYLNMVREL